MNYDPDTDDLDTLGQNESFEDSQAEMRQGYIDALTDGIVDASIDYRDPSYESREPKVRLSPALEPGMPAPPAGFQYWGMDKLDHPSRQVTSDIIMFDLGEWFPAGDDNQFYGASPGPWALRVGSDVWKKNCLFDPKDEVVPDMTLPLEDVVAQLLYNIGWNCPLDAQHSHLRNALPALRELLK